MSVREIVRATLPTVVAGLIGTAVCLGSVALAIQLISVSAIAAGALVVAVMIGVVVMLARRAQLVATSDGVRFGGGTIVPWHEIAEINVQVDGTHDVDGAHMLDREAGARGATTISLPFLSHPSRRALRSQGIRIYFSFEKWWTRFRLPSRMAFMNTPNLHVAHGTRWWNQRRGRKIDVAVWLVAPPASGRAVVAQLEALRAQDSAMPAAYVLG